jgi:hypothetical protein
MVVRWLRIPQRRYLDWRTTRFITILLVERLASEGQRKIKCSRQLARHGVSYNSFVLFLDHHSSGCWTTGKAQNSCAKRILDVFKNNHGTINLRGKTHCLWSCIFDFRSQSFLLMHSWNMIDTFKRGLLRPLDMWRWANDISPITQTSYQFKAQNCIAKTGEPSQYAVAGNCIQVRCFFCDCVDNICIHHANEISTTSSNS